MEAVKPRAVRVGRGQGYAMAVTLYRKKQKRGTTVTSCDTDAHGRPKYGQWPKRDKDGFTGEELECFRLAVLVHHGKARRPRVRAPKYDKDVQVPTSAKERKAGAPLRKVIRKAGYVGRPKGAKQILWERGLWVDGMVWKDDDMPMRSAWHVLGGCSDFAEELSAIQQLFADHGHIVRFSPKCHPELAGRGVEYCWASGKVWFRLVNDCVASKLKHHVHASLGKITPQLARQHARRARAYRAAYEDDHTPENKLMVEKLVQESKAHRNTMDQDLAFVLNEMRAAGESV